MDILQNKKMLAGVVAGVVLVMTLIVFVVMPMFEGGDEGAAESTDTAAAPAEAPTDAAPTPTSDASTVASAGTGAEGTPAAAGKALPPLERPKTDPFDPLVRTTQADRTTILRQQAEREIASLPALTIYNARPTAESDTGTVAQQAAQAEENAPDTTSRRMAGLVVGKNAYAILEIDGQTAVVKPGDVLPDLSRVERIERDRILLRKGRRAIFVPLSSNPTAATGGGGGPVGGPGSTYRPTGRGGYPGAGPSGGRGAAPPGYVR